MEALTKKVVLIVEADSDVGATTARVFAGRSANLALCGTDEKKLEQLEAECRTIGLADKRIVSIVKSDLHNEKEIEEVITKTVSTFGSLHTLVYLCDDKCDKTFDETTVDDLDAMHVCHVESPLLWTQHATRHLKKTKGNIVILSSGYSRMSVVGVFPYALAKAAEDQLIRVMALDLAEYGIRVNGVCPLYGEDKTKSSAPTSRSGIISNMAEYMAYLSTDSGAYVTGQCVPIGDAFDVDSTLTVT